jgi:hypothetical protein
MVIPTQLIMAKDVSSPRLPFEPTSAPPFLPLTGEDKESHFDHHRELFPFHLVIQIDYQGGEILLKPRKQNRCRDAKVRSLSTRFWKPGSSMAFVHSAWAFAAASSNLP